MVYEFKFPDIGEGITKGTVLSWKVKEGDVVKEDDTLAQIETDKAVADIPSPRTGTIEKIFVKAGNEVKVGETLVTIKEKGAPSKTPEKKESTSVIGEIEEAKEKTELFVPIKKESTKTSSKVLAMPKVRQLAKQLGTDISQIKGTGPDGRIIEGDLKGLPATVSTSTDGITTFRLTTKSGEIIEIQARGIQSINIKEESIEVSESNQSSELEEKSSKIIVKDKYDSYGYIDRVPFTGTRKTIAEHLKNSVDSVVPVTGMDEIDVTELVEMQKKESKKAAKKKIKLTFLPYITRAVINALEKVPVLNATLNEESEEIILKKYYNIGYAVATEAGLLVVVVKRAKHKTLYLIAKEIDDLAQKARDRKIDLQDLKGSSFTITNYGSIGGSFSTPIINEGESAILGIGRIKPTPIAVGKSVKIRQMLPVSLTFDHRVTDGADASYFLKYLKEELQNPKGLLDTELKKKLKKNEIFDI